MKSPKEPSLTKEEKRRVKALKRQQQQLSEMSKLNIPVKKPPGPIITRNSSSDLTVLCVRYGTRYGRDYVERLRNMVSRNLSLDYEFVCLTDDQHPIEGVRSIVQPAKNYQKLWWHKVHMFDSGLDLGRRVLYFDLDVLIHSNIDRLINNYENQFLGIRDFNRKFHPAWKNLNSSVMSWTHGREHRIYDDFITDISSATRLHGDQDWIWRHSKDRIEFWPDQWIQSYKWEIRSKSDLTLGTATRTRNFKTISNVVPPKDCSVVVFHGDPKPEDIADPFVVDNWL